MVPFRLTSAQPLTVALAAAAVPTTLWIADGLVLRRRLKAAHRDPITGLPDRPGFTKAATRVLTRHADTALVVFCDMAGFKAVNDQHGHDAGNQILAATGHRLAAWAGPHGVASRLYGDEFAALTRCTADQREHLLADLHHRLHQPVRIDGQDLDIAVSIGAATPTDLDSTELSHLLRGADVAMYEHKRERTGHYRLATRAHADAPSINGRRIGRPGTTAFAA